MKVGNICIFNFILLFYMGTNTNSIISDYNYFFENNYALIDINQDRKIDNLYYFIYLFMFFDFIFMILILFKIKNMNQRIELLEKILSNFEIRYEYHSETILENSDEDVNINPLNEDPN